MIRRKYYDKNNKEIKAGMYIIDFDEYIQKVYQNDDGDELYIERNPYIGINLLSQQDTTEWKILDEISLSEEEIVSAINNEDKFALSKLFLEKYDELAKMGIKIKNFYYSYCISYSSEMYDMFALKGFETLLDCCGYSFERQEDESNDNVNYECGYLVLKKNNFSFRMKWGEGYHYDFYSNIVDTTTAEVL